MIDEITPTFRSRFFAPGWWVRAYEAAVRLTNGESQRQNSFDLSIEAGIVPILTPFELSSLCVVLSTLQQQVMMGSPVLGVDPDHHRQFVSTNSRSKSKEFEQTLLLLSSLKILKTNEDESYETLPFFHREVWRRDKQHRTIQLELGPSDLGRQMLLGYGEPYTDLIRLGLGEQSIGNLLGVHPPLALWRSTWLDFHGIEQVLLLRLEQAMQWDFRWLALDGVFGIGLTELFDQLELPKLRNLDHTASPMMKWQKVLHGFGKKMVDHGMISLDWDDRYLAMATDEPLDKMLIWHAASERIALDEAKNYLNWVCRYFWQNVYHESFLRIMKLIAGPLFDETLGQQMEKVKEQIWQFEKEDRSAVILILDGNMPLLTPCLFIEWMVRQMKGHTCPLPTAVAELPIAQCAREALGRDQLKDQYQKFKEFIALDGEAIQSLVNIPGAILASFATRNEAQYHRYIVEQSARTKVDGAVNLKPSRPPSQVENQSLSIRPQNAVVAQTTTPEFSRSVQMKKIAGEELQNLRHRDLEGYRQLKMAYFKTLTEKDQQIIQTLQSRMPAETFDDQIKHGLIKFMVENPSSWQSAKVR